MAGSSVKHHWLKIKGSDVKEGAKAAAGEGSCFGNNVGKGLGLKYHQMLSPFFLLPSWSLLQQETKPEVVDLEIALSLNSLVRLSQPELFIYFELESP